MLNQSASLSLARRKWVEGKARRIGARVVGHVGDLCFKAGTNVENPYPLAMAAGLSDIILRALCILWPAES